MALLQISEPDEPVRHEHRLAVGIDLGTTNSLVATVRNRIPVVLPDENGHPLLPSIVRYGEQGVDVVFENWRSVVRGNIGAGGTDLTWGLDLTYLLDFDNGNSFAVGLKWLDIDFEKENNFGIDAHFFGATIGYNFD